MNFTHPTYILIERLLDKNGPMSIKQVAAELRMSYSGIKTAIKKMSSLNLVERIKFGGEAPATGGPAPHTYILRK